MLPADRALAALHRIAAVRDDDVREHTLRDVRHSRAFVLYGREDDSAISDVAGDTKPTMCSSSSDFGVDDDDVDDDQRLLTAAELRELADGWEVSDEAGHSATPSRPATALQVATADNAAARPRSRSRSSDATIVPDVAPSQPSESAAIIRLQAMPSAMPRPRNSAMIAQRGMSLPVSLQSAVDVASTVDRCSPLVQDSATTAPRRTMTFPAATTAVRPKKKQKREGF